VNSVKAASLPPTKNFSDIPELIHATPFNKECKAVEQVIECDISGPEVCKSCATQEEIFPNVVVGELKVDDFCVSKNSLWYFSKSVVAPREDPKLIPKLSVDFHFALFIASLET
jgi:hypothetical protein